MFIEARKLVISMLFVYVKNAVDNSKPLKERQNKIACKACWIDLKPWSRVLSAEDMILFIGAAIQEKICVEDVSAEPSKIGCAKPSQNITCLNLETIL